MRLTKKYLIELQHSMKAIAQGHCSPALDRQMAAWNAVLIAHLKRTPLDQLSGKAGRLTKAERARWDALLAAAK